jgi:hypothetical protein
VPGRCFWHATGFDVLAEFVDRQLRQTKMFCNNVYINLLINKLSNSRHLGSLLAAVEESIDDQDI